MSLDTRVGAASLQLARSHRTHWTNRMRIEVPPVVPSGHWQTEVARSEAEIARWTGCSTLRCHWTEPICERRTPEALTVMSESEQGRTSSAADRHAESNNPEIAAQAEGSSKRPNDKRPGWVSGVIVGAAAIVLGGALLAGVPRLLKYLRGTSAIYEQVDNHYGARIYRDPLGRRPDGDTRLPYGSKISVKCWIPNEGPWLTSVKGFYRIADGPLAGEYVVADVMTNDGPLGATTSPTRDPRVSRC